jgi:hypothetical protein
MGQFDSVRKRQFQYAWLFGDATVFGKFRILTDSKGRLAPMRVRIFKIELEITRYDAKIAGRRRLVLGKDQDDTSRIQA